MLTYSAAQMLVKVVSRRPDPCKDISEEEFARLAMAEKKQAAKQARRTRIWQRVTGLLAH